MIHELVFRHRSTMERYLARFNFFSEHGVVGSHQRPGYCFPRVVISQLAKLSNLSFEEELLHQLLDRIGANYVIAYVKDDRDTAKHLWKNAQYVISSQYRNWTAELFERLPNELQDRVTTHLEDRGYPSSVWLRELQASLSDSEFWGDDLFYAIHQYVPEEYDFTDHIAYVVTRI